MILKNILSLSSGTALSVAIPILLMPILTRLYTPIDFGKGELFVLLSSVLSILVTGRYELSLFIPEKDSDANTLFSSILMLIFYLSIALSLVILATLAIGNFFDFHLAYYWQVLPLTVAATGIFDTIIFLFLRYKAIKYVVLAKILFSSSIVSAKVVFGFLKFTEEGIIFGMLCGQWLTLGLLIYLLPKILDQFQIPKILVRSNWNHLKNHLDFPKNNMPQTFLTMFKDYALGILIYRYWGAGNLGLYSLSLKILKTPLYLIGNATSDILYQSFSENGIHGYQQVKTIYKKLALGLLALAIPYFASIAFLPTIISSIFGENWNGVGQISMILAPVYFVTLFILQINRLGIVLKKQSFVLKMNGSTDIIGTLCILGLGLYGANFHDALGILSLITTIFFGLYIFLLLYFSKKWCH